MRILVSTLLAGCTLFVGMPAAFAQNADDIIMRRPLPGNAEQTPPTEDPDEEPDEPDEEPDEPTDPGDTPDGFVVEPPLVVRPPTPLPPLPDWFDPDWDRFAYIWHEGPWQGSATCGQESTLTRQVYCVRMLGSAGRDNDPTDLYGGGQPGLYGNWTPEPVDPNLCGGSPPPTTYRGTQANCPGTVISPQTPGSLSPWMVYTEDEGEGQSATCSSRRFRITSPGCQAGVDTGNQQFCGLAPGGQKWSEAPYDFYRKEWQYSTDYSGCTADWELRVSNERCVGSAAMRTEQYVCRENHTGRILTGVEEAKCSGPKPGLDGDKQFGTCYQERETDMVLHCSGHENPVATLESNTHLDGVNDTLEAWFWRGHDWCRSGGYACCETRWGWDFNTNTRRVQTIATGGSSAVGTHSYEDPGNRNLHWYPSGSTISSQSVWKLPPRPEPDPVTNY